MAKDVAENVSASYSSDFWAHPSCRHSACDQRKAFVDTMKDPAFLADAEKSKLEINPLTGEEVERIAAGFFKLSPALIAKLKEIVK